MRNVESWDRARRLDDVVRSAKVSRLDLVRYKWNRRNLWRHRFCRHFCGASNVVPGLLHVTFCGGGAWIEVLENHFLDMLGQPRTNPWRVAFRSMDIMGLHNDWCANMTELA